MSVFGMIEQRLQADWRRGALDNALDRWRGRHVCLQLATDFQDLMRMGRSGVRQLREATLGALCLEAAAGDEVARHTLIWLLLPALLREARALGTGTKLEPDDLYGEMLAGLFSEVANVRTGDPNIAGRLLNRARWRAREASRAARDRDAREILVADHAEDGSATVEGWESEAEWRATGLGRLEGADIVRRAAMEGLITWQDAEIVTADRQTSTELCARWNLSAYALQCRRKRIRLRLADWFRKTFPDVGPS